MVLMDDVDRGWAWVALVAAYAGMVIYCIPLYTSGILFIALLREYGESETKTSLVGAISSGLLGFAGLLAGVLNNKVSCRTSIVLGGSLSTVGFAAGAFVTSLDWMIVTCGVLVGFGYGISSSGLVCVIGYYFEKWRDTVLSGVFLSVGVAILVSAPLGLFLVANYGLSYTLMLFACLQAQLLVIGVICRPSGNEKKLQNKRRKETSSFKTFLDISLLTRWPFLFFLFSTAAWNFGLCVGVTHLPNYIDTIGGTTTDISLLMTSFSVANIIGRLTGCLTVSKFHEKCVHIHVATLALSGLCTSLLALYSKLAGGTLLFAVQLGACTGLPNSMMTPLAVRFVGIDKMSEAYGLAYLFCGIGVITGPILTSYLFSMTGSYEYSLIAAGLVLLLGSVCGAISLCIKPRASDASQRRYSVAVEVDEKESFLDVKVESEHPHHRKEKCLHG